ncbi:MAG: WG repeat-containing protein, partial [Treponema sp.]|nr:WG repeat-containing protein [Treponema sp.]
METQILTSATDQVREEAAQMEQRQDAVNAGTGGFLQAGETLQGYCIQKRLSSAGGEAEIYLCTKDNQNYVLKYFYTRSPDPEILEKLFSFSSEHSDIIAYIDSGTYKGRHFLILEYAEGGALDDKNPDGTWKYLPVSEEAALQIIKETINAFDICHKNGIIHRDIKPGNLFYKSADGNDILVGDFGIASAFEADQGMSKHLTKAGGAHTAGYAAPEVFTGLIGPELDYYALGVTLWVLLTGKEPFVNENGHPMYEGQIALDTIQGKTADLLLARSPELSKRMQTLIRGLLTVRHEKRWGHKELSRFLAGENVEVFTEAVRDLPPLEIAGQKYYDYKTIAEALLAHPEEARSLVFKGKLAAWLIRIDQEFAEKIQELTETFSTQNQLDKGLVFVAYNLYPGLPFALDRGEQISSLQDMASLLETNPEAIIPYLRDEKRGLYTYLEAVGLAGIADKVREVVQAVPGNFKLIPRITVALKGNTIKPFQDGINNDGELREIEQLYNLDEYLKERTLLFIERRCGDLPAWIENLTGKNLELWLCKPDRQKEKLIAWGKWKYFTLFLEGNDIQCGEVFEENRKKGFKDPFGNVLLPAVWEDVQAESITGRFIVERNGKWGIVHADGSVVLPFEYDSIEVFDEERHLYTVSINGSENNKEWQIITEGGNVLDHRENNPFHIIGVGNKLFFWNKWQNNIHICNEKGEVIQKIPYPDFEEYTGTPVTVIKQNKKSGIASADGTLVVPVEYEGIVIHGKGARYFVNKNGKWGLLDPGDKSFLIPCEYDTLQCDKGAGNSYILQKGGVFDVYVDNTRHTPPVCHIVKQGHTYNILDPQKNVLATVLYIQGLGQTFDNKGWCGGDVSSTDDTGLYCLLKCYEGEKFLSVNIRTHTVSERNPDPNDGKHL